MAASAYQQTPACLQDLLYGLGPRPGMGLGSEMSRADNEKFLNLRVSRPDRPPQTDVDFLHLRPYPASVVALAPLPPAEFFLPGDSKRLPMSRRAGLPALSPEEKMALELRAFEANEAWFQRHKQQLMAEHPGQKYVAVRREAPVLFGESSISVAKRFYASFGDEPVYIGRLREEEDEVVFSSPEC